MDTRHDKTREGQRELDALLNLDDGLSDWEVEFIHNLDQWRGPFTDGQLDKLQQIYEDRVIDGRRAGDFM